MQDGLVCELSRTPRFEEFGKVTGLMDGMEVEHAWKIEL